MVSVRGPLLCAALLLLLSQLPGELRAEYGVKLCGREFIRAVIFTCGGSRWKRLSLEAEDGGDWRRDTPGYRRRTGDAAIQDSSNKELNQLKLQPFLESRIDHLENADFPLRQRPLKDTLNIYDDYSDYAPSSDDFNAYVRQAEESTRKAQSGAEVSGVVGSDRFPWMNRRRREASVGVAGICCKWGCTKAEISTLC
ncbi:prorelaxin H1 [Spea bombifrons]|uniref:prorelaxin H1 n=1 Tax=Spea bombifrons TaxID=233779 RepID=UPI00234BE62A|nr:prorelaxin H1 [Spea bombifrons]